MKKIELTRGLEALVDDADFSGLNRYSWHALQTAPGVFYAARSARIDGEKKIILMHRQITDAPADMDVDHKNRNRLDCQRHNLRVTTRSRNLAAKPTATRRAGKNKSSNWRGVSFHPQNRNWTAQISVNGKKRHLGSFEESFLAAKAYDAEAGILFGEFATLNFPDTVSGNNNKQQTERTTVWK